MLQYAVPSATEQSTAVVEVAPCPLNLPAPVSGLSLTEATLVLPKDAPPQSSSLGARGSGNLPARQKASALRHNSGSVCREDDCSHCSGTPRQVDIPLIIVSVTMLGERLTCFSWVTATRRSTSSSTSIIPSCSSILRRTPRSKGRRGRVSCDSSETMEMLRVWRLIDSLCLSSRTRRDIEVTECSGRLLWRRGSGHQRSPRQS